MDAFHITIGATPHVFDEQGTQKLSLENDLRLDIRQELERPLTRFRSAMIKFSSEIKSASWDLDFVSDADQVFRREVAPTILDIEEEISSSTIVLAIY